MGKESHPLPSTPTARPLRCPTNRSPVDPHRAKPQCSAFKKQSQKRVDTFYETFREHWGASTYKLQRHHQCMQETIIVQYMIGNFSYQ